MLKLYYYVTADSLQKVKDTFFYIITSICMCDACDKISGYSLLIQNRVFISCKKLY